MKSLIEKIKQDPNCLKKIMDEAFLMALVDVQIKEGGIGIPDEYWGSEDFNTPKEFLSAIGAERVTEQYGNRVFLGATFEFADGKYFITPYSNVEAVKELAEKGMTLQTFTAEKEKGIKLMKEKLVGSYLANYMEISDVQFNKKLFLKPQGNKEIGMYYVHKCN